MTFRELQRKFRNDTITQKELEELRRIMDETPDKELEDALACDWAEFAGNADMASVMDIKEKIDHRLAVSRRRRILWRAAAAAVLLVGGMFLGYMVERPVDRGVYTDVSTGIGGRTSLNLPDGTTVDLDANSAVWYLADAFVRDTRRINFEGRAYFDVAKDAEHPFIIDAGGVEVRVLGTSFNLDAPSGESAVLLTLESGKVSLSTCGTAVEVVPGQEAYVDRHTGSITVSETAVPAVATAWRRNELIFDRAPLSKVCASFCRIYEMDMDVAGGELEEETFSGTLPTDNVIEAVDIVCRAFGLQPDFYTTGKVVLKK
ncbi:MAG: hypothetical protein HDS65_02285 [Bacteroidales bacterium]|nr:hypothetical protein [Bacteroidales bacterium]